MEHLDSGAWLVFPFVGAEPGTGGDAYAVVYFGKDELGALRYVNSHSGFRAVYVVPGESILVAEEHRDEVD